METYGLSDVALAALNRLDLGGAFKLDELLLDDVLQMLRSDGPASNGERVLTREIAAMPQAARESLSRAISAAMGPQSAAARLGRLGGKARSDAKTRAARANARLPRPRD